MSKLMALDGNEAIAYGVLLSQVQLIAAYPITPQTPIVETLSNLVARKQLNATYINVESEHSALSAVIGASSTGVRTFTASASHGLALMHELTGVASASRLPIVMAVVSRAIPGPMCLWCDHSDIMSQRDQGWIQLFAKSPQEALDFIMIAYRLAESEDVMTPVMVDIDGFYVSHLTEIVEVPTAEEANYFIKEYEEKNLILDTEEPYAIDNLTSPEIFTEIKYSQKQGMDSVLPALKDICIDFNRLFHRSYSVVESYNCENAETIIVCMGSMASTAIHFAKKHLNSISNLGILRIICYRPFPYEEVRKMIGHSKTVVVIDRVASIGAFGPLFQDVITSLREQNCTVFSFVAGLGGRDIPEATFNKILFRVNNLKKQQKFQVESEWIDLKTENIDGFIK